LALRTKMKEITFRQTKRIPSRSVQRLFRRMEFSDWLTNREIEWYVSHALFVVCAWHGRKLVGLGLLTGDGKINVTIDAMIVDQDYQRRGIGTELLTRMVKRTEKLQPYFFQVGTCAEMGEDLYRKFGFTDGGPTMLNHEPTTRRWTQRANRDRRRRRRASGGLEPAWRRAHSGTSQQPPQRGK